LETACIAEKYQDIFYAPIQERRDTIGQFNFYDSVFMQCGLFPPLKPKLDEFYFDDEEIAWGEKWRSRNKDKFILIMPITGSCFHKLYTELPRLTHDILTRYEDAVIYLTGDEVNKESAWEHPRIHNICGKPSIKQAFMMTKHADMVIGGETGIVASAGMWGTPKIMLCTATSVYQATKYHENDFSIQAQTECSPCHRSIYGPDDCQNIKVDGGFVYPKCIESFDYDYILDRVDYVYRNLRSGIPQQVC